MPIPSFFVATVALLVTAQSPVQDQGSRTRVTGKAVDEFGECFIATQQRASRPWWFVPSPLGGTFSNSGASGGDAVYFLRVQRTEHGRETRLLLEAPSPQAAQAVTAAIDTCS